MNRVNTGKSGANQRVTVRQWCIAVLVVLGTFAPAVVAAAQTLPETDIRASRIVHYAPGSLPDKPAGIFTGVDMMNLFIVVETGDHHVTVLDGGKLEPVHRFQGRPAPQGTPQFTPDGRYAYFASRDGWISKFDIWNLRIIAEIRAGTETRSVAISADGKILAVANDLPRILVLLDAELNVLKVHAVKNKDGKMSSDVSAVYDAAPRRSFVAALTDAPEIWEISYNPAAEELPVGMIHDFQYREGTFIPGFLNPRRTSLSEPLDDFLFTREGSELMGANRATGKVQVINLDVRKKIADLNLQGIPQPGAGITWQWQGKAVMAVPNTMEGVITLVDVVRWQIIKSLPASGPGFFMCSHEKTPNAWAYSTMRKQKDKLLVFDKHSLLQVAEINTDPGKTLAHIAFTRDGKYALASLAERKAGGGALIVFDAATFKEVKRIPMDKPAGAHNMYNAIRRTDATLPGAGGDRSSSSVPLPLIFPKESP